MKSWIRQTYFGLVHAVLLLLAVELCLRACAESDPEATSSRDSVPYQLHPYFQTSFAQTPTTSRDPRFPGWPTNPETGAFDAGRKRVLFLGGSTTACNYPHMVRWLLEREIGPTTAFIAGYDWHCTLHSLYKLETYADSVQPDLVVVLEGINDFYRGFTPPELSLPEFREDYSHYSGALHAFWQPGQARGDGRSTFYAQPIGAHSHLARQDDSIAAFFKVWARESLLVRELRECLPQRERELQPTSMPESLSLRALPVFERNLRSIARSARTRGIPVLFVTMPWTLGSKRAFLAPALFFTNDGVHSLDEAGFNLGMQRFAECVEQTARAEGAKCLSLHREITNPEWFEDEVHLTRAGQEVEARAVVRAIVEGQVLRP